MARQKAQRRNGRCQMGPRHGMAYEVHMLWQCIYRYIGFCFYEDQKVGETAIVVIGPLGIGYRK